MGPRLARRPKQSLCGGERKQTKNEWMLKGKGADAGFSQGSFQYRRRVRQQGGIRNLEGLKHSLLFFLCILLVQLEKRKPRYIVKTSAHNLSDIP